MAKDRLRSGLLRFGPKTHIAKAVKFILGLDKGHITGVGQNQNNSPNNDNLTDRFNVAFMG